MIRVGNSIRHNGVSRTVAKEKKHMLSKLVYFVLAHCPFHNHSCYRLSNGSPFEV